MTNIEKKLNYVKKKYQMDFISQYTYFSLHLSNSVLPKSSPKVYKENFSFRIIVSSINTFIH